jgi:hypothetical protein
MMLAFQPVYALISLRHTLFALSALIDGAYIWNNIQTEFSGAQQ